jgi:hypothetical protein
VGAIYHTSHKKKLNEVVAKTNMAVLKAGTRNALPFGIQKEQLKVVTILFDAYSLQDIKIGKRFVLGIAVSLCVRG